MLFSFGPSSLENNLFNLDNQKETIWDLLPGIATLKAFDCGPCPFLLAARILKT